MLLWWIPPNLGDRFGLKSNGMNFIIGIWNIPISRHLTMCRKTCSHGKSHGWNTILVIALKTTNISFILIIHFLQIVARLVNTIIPVTIIIKRNYNIQLILNWIYHPHQTMRFCMMASLKISLYMMHLIFLRKNAV